MGEIVVRGKERRQDLESSWCRLPPPRKCSHMDTLYLWGCVSVFSSETNITEAGNCSKNVPPELKRHGEGEQTWEKSQTYFENINIRNFTHVEQAGVLVWMWREGRDLTGQDLRGRGSEQDHLYWPSSSPGRPSPCWASSHEGPAVVKSSENDITSQCSDFPWPQRETCWHWSEMWQRIHEKEAGHDANDRHQGR